MCVVAVVYLTLIDDALRIQPWSQDRRNQTKSNREHSRRKSGEIRHKEIVKKIASKIQNETQKQMQKNKLKDENRIRARNTSSSSGYARKDVAVI